MLRILGRFTTEIHPVGIDIGVTGSIITVSKSVTVAKGDSLQETVRSEYVCVCLSGRLL